MQPSPAEPERLCSYCASKQWPFLDGTFLFPTCEAVRAFSITITRGDVPLVLPREQFAPVHGSRCTPEGLRLCRASPARAKPAGGGGGEVAAFEQLNSTICRLCTPRGPRLKMFMEVQKLLVAVSFMFMWVFYPWCRQCMWSWSHLLRVGSARGCLAETLQAKHSCRWHF